MPLRSLLESTYDSVQDLVLAADERYWEGLELVVQGHNYGGTYLIGYVGEMLLKTAAFRFDGALPSDLVGPRLGPAKAFGAVNLIGISFESAHSVRFWAYFLEQKRLVAGRPLAPLLASELRTRVDRIYGAWWVSMRYRPSAIPATITTESRDAVFNLVEDIDWLRKNHFELWS